MTGRGPADPATLSHGTRAGYINRRCRCEPCLEWNRTAGVRWRRKYQLNHLYGISLEDFDEMYRRQDGRCAICRRPEAELRGRHTRLCVDHNHDTGAVRGLLCAECNLGIGALRGDDGPELLQRAVEYLSELRVALPPRRR